MNVNKEFILNPEELNAIFRCIVIKIDDLIQPHSSGGTWWYTGLVWFGTFDQIYQRLESIYNDFKLLQEYYPQYIAANGYSNISKSVVNKFTEAFFMLIDSFFDAIIYGDGWGSVKNPNLTVSTATQLYNHLRSIENIMLPILMEITNDLDENWNELKPRTNSRGVIYYAPTTTKTVETPLMASLQKQNSKDNINGISTTKLKKINYKSIQDYIMSKKTNTGTETSRQITSQEVSNESCIQVVPTVPIHADRFNSRGYSSTYKLH